MSPLSNAILHILPDFPEEELSKGLEAFQHARFLAKDHILSQGEVCDWLFLAESSITRCYYLDQDEQEQTLWMKPEGVFITEYKSFVHRQPSGFSLQFYEDTEVWMIHRDKLLELYQNFASWAMFGTRLTEEVHITLIDVFVNLLANDATSNYRYIEYAFPRFIQVAPLKDIASMLQVSQVTLSRIRSGTQTKT